MRRLPFLFLALLLFLPVISSAKELPKIAVWNLLPRGTKSLYAEELTSVLVSEVAKLKTYEVYSQDNVRVLAGWTAQRMELGSTDTKCLIALGQMDIAKLISGSVGKIGDRYIVSLNLFDTQNAKAEKAVSEFCRSEDELIELVQIAVRKLLGETAADWYERGFKKEGKEAVKAFTKALELDPGYVMAYIFRGVTYAKDLKYYQLAIKDFDKAVELDPKSELAYGFRGTLYLHVLGNYQQATKDFDRCIELSPGYKPHYIRRGQAYFKIGNYQQAIKDFDTAIKVKTDDYGVGREVQENDVDAYFGRGRAYFMIGDYQMALKDFDKAIELDPMDAKIYLDRGAIYDHLGDREKALRDYKTAARLGYKEAQDLLMSMGSSW